MTVAPLSNQPHRTRPAPVALVEAVHVTYEGHEALCHVDLQVASAALTVVAGHNGAGKSTLVEVLAGVRPVASGRVAVHTRSVAFVPQRTAVPTQLPVTVREVVAVGAWGESGPWRRLSPDGEQRVRDAMARLGLAALARRPFGTLSGGERQRALLAQGLARGADLLLLDEPTTGLDTRHAAHICDAIASEVARGAAVVCASHDQAVIDQADHVVRLEQGRLVT